ncbi:MAG: nucleotidyltransferase family protein [Christensenellaceae bacterium]|nr:nucleotidyltransferase family protein [Christensenellaceae bacterium]
MNDAPKVVGIVAEYDPFHLGHKKQIIKAKESADYVICIISCAFSQRGGAHMFSTHTRAHMALASGADLVLGLPYSFGCAQANRFAMGGVSVLNSLGVVTHLCFGVEEELLPILDSAADAIKSKEYDELFMESLSGGVSSAKAHGIALSKLIDLEDSNSINAPNFILGLCYIKALQDIKSDIVPLPIARQGDYHKGQDIFSPSASIIRKKLLKGDTDFFKAALPPESYNIVIKVYNEGYYHKPQALDYALIAKILSSNAEELTNTPEISEGLENRIIDCALSANSRDKLISLIKTKRYPYTRIDRALSHILVGLTNENCSDKPNYVRLLGFRNSAAPLLSAISKDMPLISRPARNKDLIMKEDMFSEQLWQIGAGECPKIAYEEQVVII